MRPWGYGLRPAWRQDRVRRRPQIQRFGCTPGREVYRSSDKMIFVHDQDGLRSSYQFLFLYALQNTGYKDNKSFNGGGTAKFAPGIRTDRPHLSVGVITPAGSGIRATAGILL